MANAIDKKTLSLIKSVKSYQPYDSKALALSKNKLAINDLPNYQKRTSKIVADLKTAIELTGLRDGMTISFHHHFRNGDKTVEHVMQVIKSMNIKNLTVAASSFTQAHRCLIDYIKDGTIVALQTSGCRGELAQAISDGVCKVPMIIRSHGGRARAVASGDLQIDVAFLAASSSDDMGNANGVVGKSICGSLGYAKVDAQYAHKTIIITDTIVNYPNYPISISQIYVDYVVKMDEIGDPKGIMTGAIRMSSNPKEAVMAELIAKIIVNTEWFKDGFGIQSGSGGAALGAFKAVKEQMKLRNIRAGFCLGGITSQQVELLKEGMVDRLLDTQSFDLSAAQSLLENENHIEISASEYANPHNKSCCVDKLDYVILSALEVDVDFNVNVITGSDGVIRGASGGHGDTAYGANVSIVVCPLIRGRLGCVVDRVQTIVTPGSTVDIVVTDFGIAVNPLRVDLLEQLNLANIKLVDINDLKQMAEKIIGHPEPIAYEKNKIVGIIEYRDGSVIDVVNKTVPFKLN